MNAGLSSLTSLKAQILAASLRARTDWDTQLFALGLGVAGAIEGSLGRRLARLPGDTHTVPGNQDVISLPRYPLEAVSAVAYRERVTDDWSDATSSLFTWNAASGLVYLEGQLTTATGQIRVTYTGGYWWDDTENNSGSLPAGATALPAALLTAWHTQVEAMWRAKDKLGLKIKEEAETGSPAQNTIELLPSVLTAIAPFRRLAL